MWDCCEFCYLNKKYLFTTQMYIYTLQSIRNMTCLQRNLKDVRNTCLKQWIMDALITHTSTYAHTFPLTCILHHTHTNTHMYRVTFTFSPVCWSALHHLVKSKMNGLWYKWCFPITSASPCYQAASNTDGKRIHWPCECSALWHKTHQ